jgi:hypothetical protein
MTGNLEGSKGNFGGVIQGLPRCLHLSERDGLLGTLDLVCKES